MNSEDFEIEVRRRGNFYILVANKFGVVVETKNLECGLKEAGKRIAVVAADLKESKSQLESTSASSAFDGAIVRPGLYALLIAGACTALIILFLWVPAPLIDTVMNFRHAVSAKIPAISLSGREDPGPEIERLIIPSGPGPTAPLHWLTSGSARVNADGSASGGADDQIYQVFPVPASAMTVSGIFSLIGDTWNGTLMLDVVWYSKEQEIARRNEAFGGVKDRPLAASFQYPVPVGADRLILIVRTWRPQDGYVKLRRATVSWHQSKIKGPWFDVELE
jgi:hypothetical protein